MKVNYQSTKTSSEATESSVKSLNSEKPLQFVDMRPEAKTQQKLKAMAENSHQVFQLKSFENISNGVGNNETFGKELVQLVKRKRESDSEDEDFIPPQGKKQKRYHIPKATTEQVIRQTAHKRKNVNKGKFKNVYTCPACRRPLASERSGGKGLELTRFSYTSKSGKLHNQRALALDHYPPWAPRERALKGKHASEDEIRENHNDPTRLRALCKPCNESHHFESRKNIEYESDSDEEGYYTDESESENEGFYAPFRYDKGDDDQSSGGGGAVTT